MAYEWHVPIDITQNQVGIDRQEISYISAFFTPSKSLNESFHSRGVSIIDLKNTKKDLYVIDGRPFC